MTISKLCIECGSVHWTVNTRCPACHGVRLYHQNRYKNFLADGIVHDFSDDKIFQIVYGRE